jgi:hypothetical protein
MCRLYLQVTSLSDITCGYGQKYTQAYQCIHDDTIPHHYIWPIQPRPSSSAIKVWRKALRTCFPRTNGDMTYSLGQWLSQPSAEWNWFYYPPSQLIFQRYSLFWRIWRRHSRAGNLGLTPRFRYDTNGLQRPLHSVWATIKRQGHNNLILTGWIHHDNDAPFSFQDNHNTSWILRDSETPNQLQVLKQSIEKHAKQVQQDGLSKISINYSNYGVPLFVQDHHNLSALTAANLWAFLR